MSPILKAGLAYFAVVFAVGFALGLVRVLWLVPPLGERTAELAETPLMLLAIVLAARWIVRRWRLPARRPPRIAAGLIALALLVGVELGVVLRLRGLTLSEYLAARDPVSGAVYALSLLLFALMPALVARDSRR